MKQLHNHTPMFPLWLVLGLVALTVPRAIVHDLKLLPFTSLPYIILAVTPWLIWLAVALLHKTKKPLMQFLIIGLTYGVVLGITHQLLWDMSWGNNPPQLHGNLEGQLDATLEAFVLRCAAFASSLATGVITGFIFGVIATAAAKIRPLVK